MFSAPHAPGRALERPSVWADIGAKLGITRPTETQEPPTDWPSWLTTLFPETFTADLAPYHADFWNWLWRVKATGAGPDNHNTYAAIWARGWGKSTHIETGVIALAAHAKRRYGWYISGTQAQADEHVQTVSEKLLSSKVPDYYPELASARVQLVGDKSRQLGWRRQRLYTADGFVLDALGLDSAARGAKINDQRPDFMIFDDVDHELDSETTLDRKEAALTRRIIPAGSPDCVYLAGQNLVHPNGIITKMVDGRAKFLGSLTVSGPHPAVLNLVTEGSGKDALIIEGTPTWAFMGLAVCQKKITDAGLDSFLSECQHEIGYMGDPRFSREALAVHQTNVRDPLPRAAIKDLGDWTADPYLAIWQLPISGVAYCWAFDGAEGVGSDYCVTTIVRASDGQPVAMLRDNKREQREHAGIAAKLIQAYGNGMGGWGRDHEADFATVMFAEGITWVYEHPQDQTQAGRLAGNEPTKRRGYPQRHHERMVLVARIGRYIERHEGIIPSQVIVNEAMRFVKTEKQPDGEAAPGAHDDALLSWGLALLMRDQPGAQAVYGTQREPQPAGQRKRGW